MMLRLVSVFGLSALIFAQPVSSWATTEIADLMDRVGKTSAAQASGSDTGTDSGEVSTETCAPASAASEPATIIFGSTSTSSTTSITFNSSTSTSTTVTLPAPGTCATIVSGGQIPTTTDCLFILQVSTMLRTCDPECGCAPKGTLPVTSTDALICLNAATGIPVALRCPCNG